MINLEEFKFVIDGNDYVPLKVAQQAVSEASGIADGSSQIEDAVSTLKKAVEDMNNSINTISND